MAPDTSIDVGGGRDTGSLEALLARVAEAERAADHAALPQAWADVAATACARYGQGSQACLRARSNHASWVAEVEDADRGSRLLAEIAERAGQTLGPAHLETLRIRANAAAFRGLAGDAPGAEAELREVLALLREVHPDKWGDHARIEGNRAHWSRQAGLSRTL